MRMIYWGALAIFVLLASFLGSRAFRRYRQGTLSRGLMVRNIAMVALPALLVVAPLIMEVGRVGHPVSMDAASHGTLYLMLTAAGTILGAAVFGWRYWVQYGTSAHFTHIGANVLGLVICAYMGVVVVDQMLFFGTSNDAGIVNWDTLRSSGEVKDLKCESDLLIVNNADTDEVTYRCPSLFVLGPYTNRPFAPWPSYTKGTSPQLATAIHRMFARASLREAQ